MKTKFLFSLLLCLSMAFNLSSQTLVCNNPPTCIQNGDLLGPTAGGNMNSTAALTVPNWFVSHGTPSYGPSSVWMWSYGGQGEGMFTCYSFVSGRQYRVCFRASYQGTTPTGVYNIFASNGLPAVTPVGFGGPVPVPTSSQLISNPNITNPVWTSYSYVFTANANYSQLWLYPYLLAANGTQYAVSVDNIHVEDLSIPDPAITITPSGPFVNGIPVNLTASGAPAGATYNWSPSGLIGNPETVTPNCDDQVISVTASYNNCPLPGVQICERTTAPASINVRATEGCCATVKDTVYCDGLNAMMDFWITNNSTFTMNGYRLHILPSGAVVDWNNAFSIPVGLTGGPFTINLTALGLTPGEKYCFYLEMLRYGQELCPEESCKTQEFCIVVPKDCNVEDCCNRWGTIAYDDYSNPQAPVSRITKCGARLDIPCGTRNGFDFNYTCKEGCSPRFKSELYNEAGMVIYTNSSTTSSNWYRVSGLPLTSTGVYRLRVYVYCGDKLCETCDLYLVVNCEVRAKVSNAAPMIYSIIPNPASTMATILSKSEPIVSYVVQTRDGVVLLSKTGINKNEVTIDIRTLPNGLYTVIINGRSTNKLIKQE